MSKIDDWLAQGDNPTPGAPTVADVIIQLRALPQDLRVWVYAGGARAPVQRVAAEDFDDGPAAVIYPGAAEP